MRCKLGVELTSQLIPLLDPPGFSASSQPCNQGFKHTQTALANLLPTASATHALRPQGDDYILYCHPQRQKTPRSDRLREWYLTLLRTARDQGVVAHLGNLFDTFFEGGRGHRDRVSASLLPHFDGEWGGQLSLLRSFDGGWGCEVSPAPAASVLGGWLY